MNGTGFTRATVTANERLTMLLLGCPSSTVTVTTENPLLLADGARRSTAKPFGLAYWMVGWGMMDGCLDIAATTRVSISFGAPLEMPVKMMAWGPAFPLIVTSRIGSSVGGSFTGLTVRRKPLVAVTPSPSVTVTVRRAVPNWLADGRMVSVRSLPPPRRRSRAHGLSQTDFAGR